MRGRWASVASEVHIPDELGREVGVVRVVPYNPAWPQLYAAEAARLQGLLHAVGVSLILEHTGSTAIPGLPAKPILDILAGRTTDCAREPAIRALAAAGYLYRGEEGIPGRDFFRRGEPRPYHVHLALVGSPFWNEHRIFRDYLRVHPEIAADYGRLKYDLASRHPTDRGAYIDGKTAFVAAALARARVGEPRLGPPTEA
jgi:GrpB-like predicted nucleotidyltransferase (UPF0157 family)